MSSPRKNLLSAGISALLSAALINSIPVKAADVKPEIHKLCAEAKDYVGCVRAMKGDTSARVINSQGADIAEGNQCPAGSAYMGGGNCQQVQCEYTTAGAIRALGHDQLIAGKKDNKGKDMGLPVQNLSRQGALKTYRGCIKNNKQPKLSNWRAKTGLQ